MNYRNFVKSHTITISTCLSYLIISCLILSYLVLSCLISSHLSSLISHLIFCKEPLSATIQIRCQRDKPRKGRSLWNQEMLQPQMQVRSRGESCSGLPGKLIHSEGPTTVLGYTRFRPRTNKIESVTGPERMRSTSTE